MGHSEHCGIWPDDHGPCGEPVVERLWYLNEWMDHPGHGQGLVQAHGINPSDIAADPGPALGLGLCATHLEAYLGEQLLGQSMPGR